MSPLEDYRRWLLTVPTSKLKQYTPIERAAIMKARKLMKTNSSEGC